MVEMSRLSEEAKMNYYPTPKSLAEKMVTQIEGRMHSLSVLEPSAGDGELIYALNAGSNLRNCEFDIDYIEIDPDLRAIAKNRFSGDEVRRLQLEQNSIKRSWNREIGEYVYEIPEEKQKYDDLEKEIGILSGLLSAKCIWDDFLTFETYKKYDLIIMNPPFSNGDRHLLKAIQLQERTGGKVVALLNAETIRNPYSVCRKELVEKLNFYNANIEYIKNAFFYAERKTSVEVALVYCNIAEPEKHSYIWENLQKAEEEKRETSEYYVAKQHGNYAEMLIEQYNFEVAATLKLVDEYEAMKPYLMDKFQQKYISPIITLSVEGNSCFDLNKYLKSVRLKYWNELFYNPEFTGALTSDLRKEFYKMVESMKNYDFNEFNIIQIKERMAKAMYKTYNDTIIKLFDKLSCVHAWSGEPEETNIHYYTGWKTNKSWKINDKKVIIPCYGTFGPYWNTGFRASEALDLLSDIEQTLNYLDNGETAPSALSLFDIMHAYDRHDQARNIDCKYFKVTFYKKGTCHIVWKNKRLIEKLNIYGSQKKGWLPPAYGKKTYEDMDETEKTVIDAFQGEDAYNRILSEKDYYLANGFSFLQIAG